MSQAVDTWKKKLDSLLKQEAINSDPAQKFTLAEQIAEAKAKIAELETPDIRKPPDSPGPIPVDISRIDKYGPAELIGRESELSVLSVAWDKVCRAETPRPHVLTFVALGGEGKTSLVAKWVAKLASQDWPGCEGVFAWSFYTQGTREQLAAPSDLFLATALKFFGDPATASGAQGAFDKGRRLAQLVGQLRALLILDGLEPLQFSPTSHTSGELRDLGLSALLKGLAAYNQGLCVVTTRYSIPDLRTYWQTTAPEHHLKRLSTAAGVDLLQKLGVRKASGLQAEFEKLVDDVQGHALTLTLLGSYLHDAHAGDIRKRDLVKLEEADAEEQGAHAFRVMDTYVEWLETGGKNEQDNLKGRCAVAVLRLLGLFDRPATGDCLAALLKEPAIPGLSEALVGMSETQRNLAFTRLESAKLLTINRDAAGTLVSLDAHPLIREYFAKRLQVGRQQALRSSGSPGDDAGADCGVTYRDAGDAGTAQGLFRPTAWREGHRRLYEHLCASTPDKPQPTLEDLQPLYQAVAHGCQAGYYQVTFQSIYLQRIHGQKNDHTSRREDYLSWQRHGSHSLELSVLANFFVTLWDKPIPDFTSADQAKLLALVGYAKAVLGHSDAEAPMRSALDIREKNELWTASATSAGDLSDFLRIRGDLKSASSTADKAVVYAERSSDQKEQLLRLTNRAIASHYQGELTQANSEFADVRRRQFDLANADPERSELPVLSSRRGYHYRDFVLDVLERMCHGNIEPFDLLFVNRTVNSCVIQELLHEVENNSRTALTMRRQPDLLSDALNHITLARVTIINCMLGTITLDKSKRWLPSELRSSEWRVHNIEQEQICKSEASQHAREGLDPLRNASQQDFLPCAFMIRALQRFLSGARIGPESAQSDLDEAWEIAERGSMPLFLADICLYRARLFGRPWVGESGSVGRPATAMLPARTAYPWESAEADLKEARRLIEKHGYGRRIEELKDAEAFILGKTAR